MLRTRVFSRAPRLRSMTAHWPCSVRICPSDSPRVPAFLGVGQAAGRGLWRDAWLYWAMVAAACALVPPGAIVIICGPSPVAMVCTGLAVSAPVAGAIPDTETVLAF